MNKREQNKDVMVWCDLKVAVKTLNGEDPRRGEEIAKSREGASPPASLW